MSSSDSAVALGLLSFICGMLCLIASKMDGKPSYDIAFLCWSVSTIYWFLVAISRHLKETRKR